MKKMTTVLWGLAFIGAGAVFALNALGITSIDLFFDGWWTLFIIVPCAVGLFTQKDKYGNLFGVLLGVFLLLCAQGILEYAMLWKLFLPVMAILIGLKLVFSGLFGKKKRDIPVEIEINIGDKGTNTAIFSGSEINYNNREFTGTELTAVFGGVECDLRGAIIQKDCRINVTAVFGGIDLYMPDNVNVSTNITAIFGGADRRTPFHPDAPTVYIEGTCLFGGVEIN